MFYVYILESLGNGTYYVGSCSNLEIRLNQHNQKKVISTKRYAPWHLVYSENYDILKNARKRELQIKSWKKRSAIERLINISKLNKIEDPR